MHQELVNMTFSRYLTYITTAVLLCLCLFSSAQELPQMPSDPSVQSGVLPNGISYYVMANLETKGAADFALVQKKGDMAESVLDSLPVLKVFPRKFFSGNGAVPYNGRFLQKRGDAALFRLGEVMICAKPTLLDSTLLVLMGMADASKEVCTPSENAIIVSGDVNPGVVAEKLKMLSYMIPLGKTPECEKYIWEDSGVSKSDNYRFPSDHSEITVSWKLPRTPEHLAGTIQPAVHGKLMRELGLIAENRVRQAFVHREIPFVSVSHNYVSSAETSSDEEFAISAIVGPLGAYQSLAAMADALSSIKEKGVSVEERNMAEAQLYHRLFNVVRLPVRSDAANVELCINAFLNGSRPVTDAYLYQFYHSKEVNDTTEALALDRLADAVMNVDKNVHVYVNAGEPVSSNVFFNAWNDPSYTDAVKVMPPSDTLLNTAPQKKKLPVIFLRKEHMSKGTLWTFANGIRVVYKRMETDGRLYWAWGLSEGFGAIADLKAGEGAFATDMLKLSRIAGMSWDDYVRYLESKEIYMDANVGLSNTIIRGSAPSYELPMVMRSLRAVMLEREFDSEAFKRYKRDEWLRLEMSKNSSNRVVDSLMCPGYRYSKIKSSGKLSDELPVKTEALFFDVFSKANDGVLVIVGDQEESVVRKQLSERLGRFETRKTAASRPHISYQTASGSMTHTATGDRKSVYLAMSLPLPLTIDNYALSDVAGLVLKKRLVSAVAGTGMYAKVYTDRKITPHERFNVLVVLEEVPGMKVDNAIENARRILQKELAGGFRDLTDAQVDACKVWLKHNRSVRSSKPEFWVNALLLRYLEGKDFTSGYEARVDKVSAESVKALLESLNGSGKVEYIIESSDID